ncbi:PREDICTED: lysine-rich arabinogalactan protein 19-like, partial [Nicrophorus vespilloides]|uniref:Lysine-rich arabinogalactan protein 19-like n=1 Tax=Nicrophorus vespilloides TaxID=110193 RepID=A0ABM1MR25_NICVS
MQQQQLAAQLAHHGNGPRPPPLSPAPHTSDSDSDISLGAHSPPISSPGPLRFGATSPTPISTFRFGPHSPGPMPAQFRFGGGNPIFRMDRQSPPPHSFLSHKLRPDSPQETAANYSRADDDSPINVDSTDLKNSPPPPPINLRIADQLHRHPDIRMPEPLRLGNPPPLTAPLRIHVNSSPQTNLQNSQSHHGGIVRIAPPSPPQPPLIHRPFSPPRLT